MEEKLVVKWKEITSLLVLLLYINCISSPFMEIFSSKTLMGVLMHIGIDDFSKLVFIYSLIELENGTKL